MKKTSNYIFSFNIFRHILVLSWLLFAFPSHAQGDDFSIIKKSKCENIERVYAVIRKQFIELESIFDLFIHEFDGIPWDDAIEKIKVKGYTECETFCQKNKLSHQNIDIKVLRNIHIKNTYFFVILKNKVIQYNKIIIYTGFDNSKQNDVFRLLQLMAYPEKDAFCSSQVYKLRTIEYQCLAINYSNIDLFREIFFNKPYNHSLQLLYILSLKGDSVASLRLNEMESKFHINVRKLIQDKLSNIEDVCKYQKSPSYINVGEPYLYMPNILINYWKRAGYE